MNLKTIHRRHLACLMVFAGVFLALALFSPKTGESNQTALSPLIQSLNPQTESGSEDKTTKTKINQARQKARILHEALGGALQVMHRDYFREDERMKLPSKSLEDVFAEMAKTHQVELRWLAVNANAMSVDHKPKSVFDRKVAKELSGSRNEFDEVVGNVLHFAGAIPLSASCVRCHVKNRKSNEERKAALVISIPLK